MLKSHSLNKGQSLIELAVFSMVIFMALGALVSYAMSFNFTQRLAMMASKRVMNLAEQVGTLDSYFNANVNLIYDKTIPDPSSMFGIPKKTTLSVSASGVRSNELYAEPDWGPAGELSRVVYDVNGKVYTFITSSFESNTFSYTLNGTIKNYTTAAGHPFRKKDWKKDWWKAQNPNPDTGKAPLAWEWITTKGTAETEVRANSGWDIDEDNMDEMIILIEAAGAGRDTLKFVDYQGGLIDSAEENKDLRGGLINQFYEEQVNKNSLTNFQKGGIFSTITSQNNLRIIERYVRLNVNKGPGEFGDLPDQIRNMHVNGVAVHQGCTYSGDCSCSSVSAPEYRYCDCIGTKEDVVRGLLNVYPHYPVDIHSEVNYGRFHYRDLVLGSGEILTRGMLTVSADKKAKDSFGQIYVVEQVPVDLVAGNYFLVIRSVFAQDKNAYVWTRDLKK